MRLVEFYDIDQSLYDDFVAQQPHSQFLQSWGWGDFQRTWGKKVWHFGIKEGGKLICSAQIVSYPLRFDKSYLYCPRGPLFIAGLTKEQQETAMALIFSKARDICYLTKKENELFFRVEPDNNLQKNIVYSWPLLQQKAVQPEQSIILDLSLGEQTLLDNMQQKTRYNISLASKKKLVIRNSQSVEDLEKFLLLSKITASRNGFRLWPDKYYHRMLAELANKKMINIWLAEYQGQVAAANLVINFGDTVTYLHGGSDQKYRNLMAPHLLQWQQILWAQQNNFHYYDFWGIAEKNNPKEKDWAGITRFKKGFGGEVVTYHGAYDLVYDQKWYRLYQWSKKYF